MNSKPPLLLLHGICNNSRLFAAPDGLGAHLSQFFDLYPVDYPIYEHRHKPFDFDFHLEEDLPVIWRQVCREAGQKPAVLGYSMGGMLAMTAQARQTIDAPAIVAVASAFRFKKIPLYPTLMKWAVKTAMLTGQRTMPVKLGGRVLGALFTLFESSGNAHDLALFRNLVKTTCINVPVETFKQSLAWIRTTNLCNRTGTYYYLDDFHRIKTPTCFIYGSRDRIAPMSAVKEGFDASGSRRKAFYEIAGGGHLSMARGEQARKISQMVKAWCINPVY